MNKKYLAFLLLAFQLFVKGQEKDSLSYEKVNHLGEVTIQSLKNTAVITNAKIVALNKQNLSEATALIPSVIQAQVGSRNESFVSIRGFGSRSLPIFLDGVPVYVPFDGEMDLGRFQTANIYKISVSKGFSSMEYGANTLGGVINLVSNKPTKELQVKAQISIGSGKKYVYGFRVGSKKESFYWQGNYYQNQQETYPLSEQFTTNDRQSNLSRNNANTKDNKIGFKFGFTPNKTDEYTLNYNYQTAEKGNPTYTGNDENIRVRFWQWPQWDKQSIYFLSQTKLTTQTNVKVRLYYDTFKNQLASFDDATFSSQELPFAFTSYYDDYNIGGNVVLKTVLFKKHKINFSSHFKQDHHRSHNDGEPIIEFSDNTATFGVDHSYKWREKTDLITGVSFHNRKSLKAQEYIFSNNTINELPESNNNALNAQLAVKQKLKNQHFLLASVAYKSRFATMKDRYSYRLGRSIPNPDLISEKATHIALNYKGNLADFAQIEASAYSSFIQDAIQFVNLLDLGVNQLQNTGKALFYGFETSLEIPFNKKGNWATNYSYIIQENTQHPEILFIDIPKHHIVSVLQYKWTSKLSTSLQADYNSKRYSTDYGTTADEFGLVHFNGNYSFKGISIHGHIQNIFDTNYAFSEGFPNAGRTYSLGIRYELTH